MKIEVSASELSWIMTALKDEHIMLDRLAMQNATDGDERRASVYRSWAYQVNALKSKLEEVNTDDVS